jgi:hypothetical protein
MYLYLNYSLNCNSVTLVDFVFHFSGKGDTVVSILIDLNDFWTYENREYLVPDTAEESEITKSTNVTELQLNLVISNFRRPFQNLELSEIRLK